MKKLSANQINELWRNGRLTITAVIFPLFGILFLVYLYCDPVHKWVDEKINKILTKFKKKEAK